MGHDRVNVEPVISAILSRIPYSRAPTTWHCPLRQDCSVLGDVDSQQTCGFAGACILVDQMIASGALEERLTRLVDSDWPCCGILRTNTAGQYVRKDATRVMVNAGFSARWIIDHFSCQSVPGRVWELDRGQLCNSLIVLQCESGAHSEEGGEHASEQSFYLTFVISFEYF